MAVSLQDRKRTTPELKGWLDDVSSYERTFKRWETRVEAILKRYRDEQRQGASIAASAKFNILWSNVQTLVPATFSRLPLPSVSRRFRDNDPVGRVSSLILERGLEFEVHHYPFYRRSMKACVLDRFLGGRGTSWVRYEPHTVMQDDGPQITDDTENEGEENRPERIDYECTPVDYVHWRDFGHSVARSWPEVTRVWRKVYMRKSALVERFGEKIAKLIPMDATPEDLKRQEDYKPSAQAEAACIYEGWDKDDGTVVWFSKNVKDLLDSKADPLELEEFFPCPPPLYATTTNESLIPVPDFAIYQDQANELDILADRIDGLVKALKVTGVYDASQPALARLFTEGTNNDLIPVKNWAAFAEKNGLKGTIDIVDVQMISKTLNDAYIAFEQVKGQIDELLGIADIARGATNPNETLGAQQLKTQYLNLRLKDNQQEVALFATENLKIMAEIMCTHYQPETLMRMAAVDQLEEADKQYIVPALQMLKDEPLRNFRIEVAADSLVQIDEQQEKTAATELLAGAGAFVQQVGQGLSAVQPMIAAPLAKMMFKMFKFAVTRYRIGKTLEGEIDAAIDQMMQAIMQPPEQQADPEAMKKQIEEQVKAQVQLDNAGKEIGLNKRAADLDIRELKFAAEQEIQKNADSFREKEFDLKNREAGMNMKEDAHKIKGDLEKTLAVTEERISASDAIKGAQDSSAEELKGAVQSLIEAQTKTQEAIQGLAQVVAAERESEITVGMDGKKRARSRVVA